MTASKKIIIFTGPSISIKEASEILEAEYRYPIKRGDILEAIAESPDVIGIIDGVFHQQPAVSHREILEALKNGIVVVGGSSMGALRASELDELGMIGIGYVYQQYKTGAVESDDAVAVILNPQTHEQLSDSLISIDYNLKKARDAGILSNRELEELLDISKSIFYPKRTYEKIFKESNLDEKVIESLKQYIQEHGYDVKRKDAIEVLKYIKNNFIDSN
ncbi:MAG: TfuA-related McrA-glycine thioamidation protein [Methanobacteriaceae archaeon]|nr:TfuA-related McrA-glycine thioamidation protein [Methanobacteriaceae archaeon]